MANVFLSYARRDRERVLALASALEREGLSVWWDPNLVPGKRFRDIIARELSAADAVIVVWTAASTRIRSGARICQSSAVSTHN